MLLYVVGLNKNLNVKLDLDVDEEIIRLKCIFLKKIIINKINEYFTQKYDKNKSVSFIL